jgi:hypothetical protein
MKNNRKKEAPKTNSKKVPDSLKVFSLKNIMERPDPSTEHFVFVWIEQFLKADFETVFCDLISHLFLALGIDNLVLLKSPEFLLEKKQEAVKSLVTKENITVGLENKEMLTEFTYFLRNYVSYFFARIYGAKKNPLREHWLKIWQEILDWMFCLSQANFEHARFEIVIFEIQAIRSLIKVGQAFDEVMLAEILEPFVSKFVVERLNDPSERIKLEILTFMHSAYDDSKYIHKAQTSQTIKSKVESLILQLSHADLKVRELAARNLQTELKNEHEPYKQVVKDVLHNQKDHIIKAALISTGKEVASIFQTAALIHSEGGIFNKEDLMKYYLLMFHFNKIISQKAIEFFAECTTFKADFARGFNESKFDEMLSLLNCLFELQQKKDPEAEFSQIVERIAGQIDLSPFGPQIFFHLKELIEKPRNMLVGQKLIGNLLEFIIGFTRFRKSKGLGFLEHEINTHFTSLIDSLRDKDDVYKIAFLKMFFEVAAIQNDDQFEAKLLRINDIVHSTSNSNIIKAIYAFLLTNRPKSMAISELLKRNYDMYQLQLRSIKEDQEINEDIKMLLFRIQLISKGFLTERDIDKDFPFIEQLLKSYWHKSDLYDPSNIIKCCMGFKFSAYQGVFYRFFKTTGNLEEAMRVNEAKRAEIIRMLELYTEYRPMQTYIRHVDKMNIRFQAYVFLLNLYQMISSDMLFNHKLLSYTPSISNIQTLVNFVKVSLEDFNKNRSSYLGTEPAKLLRESLEQASPYKKAMEKPVFEHDDDFGESVNRNGEPFGLQTGRKSEADTQTSAGFSIVRFICNKTLDFLIKCSKSFGMTIGHILISLFFKNNLAENNLESSIQSFLKKVIVRDLESADDTVFWLYLLRCVLHTDLKDEQLVPLARLFLRIFTGMIKKHHNDELKLAKLYRGFYLCLSKLFTVACETPAHYRVLTVISSTFVTRKIFERQVDKLHAFYWKVLNIKKEIAEKKKSSEINDTIEKFERHLSRLLNEFRREKEPPSAEREAKLEENFNIKEEDKGYSKRKIALDEEDYQNHRMRDSNEEPRIKSRKDGKRREEKKKEKVKKVPELSDDDSVLGNRRIKRKVQ